MKSSISKHLVNFHSYIYIIKHNVIIKRCNKINLISLTSNDINTLTVNAFGWFFICLQQLVAAFTAFLILCKAI